MGGEVPTPWAPSAAASVSFSPSLGDEEELWVMGRGNSSRSRGLSLSCKSTFPGIVL